MTDGWATLITLSTAGHPGAPNGATNSATNSATKGATYRSENWRDQQAENWSERRATRERTEHHLRLR